MSLFLVEVTSQLAINGADFSLIVLLFCCLLFVAFLFLGQYQVHETCCANLRAERSSNRHNKEAAETSKRQRLDEESAMDSDDGASQDEEAASTWGGEEDVNNEGGDEDCDDGGSDEDVNDKS